MTRKKVKKPVSTVSIPFELREGWQDKFLRSAFSLGLHFDLSESMIEVFCAVADCVVCNKRLYWQYRPSALRQVATASAALVERGLIQEITDRRKLKAILNSKGHWSEYNQYELTPIGVHFAEILKLSGAFIVADASINKRSRRRRRG